MWLCSFCTASKYGTYGEKKSVRTHKFSNLHEKRLFVACGTEKLPDLRHYCSCKLHLFAPCKCMTPRLAFSHPCRNFGFYVHIYTY